MLSVSQLVGTFIVDPAELRKIEEEWGATCRPLPRALRRAAAVLSGCTIRVRFR
jgi:hypothetical protein